MDTRAIERTTEHRPWPMPARQWIMFQSWQRQLFAHWPVRFEVIRELVPPPLEVDVRDGTAWVGITPFSIERQRARLLPPLPLLSAFPELNLRTYVRFHGRPGVFFFSLDAGSTAAVLGARAFFGLPYYPASMSSQSNTGWIEYRSRRIAGGEAEFAARYRGSGSVFNAEPRSLDEFLIERYALYVVRRGTVFRGDIHHAPWPLQRAQANIEHNTLAARHGITLPDREPILHYSDRQDTLIWPLCRA